jgi:hypothetical protein
MLLFEFRERPGVTGSPRSFLLHLLPLLLGLLL